MKAHFLFRSVSLVIIMLTLAGASSASGRSESMGPNFPQETVPGLKSPFTVPSTNNNHPAIAGVADHGLTAIDVPETARPILDRLGILYQGQPRSGILRAAASARQLAALKKNGVTYSTVGKVAVFERNGQSGPLGGKYEISCSAENWNKFPIPMEPAYWGYDLASTNCAVNGTVDWVDLHFIITNAYFTGQPPTGQGLTEIYVNLGVENPWQYVNVGESYHFCVPYSPSLGGPQQPVDFGNYDRWIFNVDNTMGTHLFAGRPVNQYWDLAVRQGYCPYSPQATVAYWGLWVYYSAWEVFLPEVDH